MELKLDRNKTYGLALEGGGAKGAYQIGAWKALREAGIRFSAVSGTSVGALNGAMIVMDDLEKAENVWNNIHFSQVMDVDDEGAYTTPLVGDAECAYSYTENGVTLCAVERAFREGRCSFRKPISCHLYPIRVVRFSNGTLGLNYHRWEVCRPAVECGRRLGIPVYKALREPIVRRFGEEFYRALEAAEEFLREQER